jgi:hypothetical protein
VKLAKVDRPFAILRCMKKLPEPLKDYINSLIQAFHCRMFEVKQGFIYLLVDHHKYIQYKREAKRMKLGKAEWKDGYYYLTEVIQ